MTGLTKQEVKEMSEILGIAEEQLLCMSEDELLDALSRAIQELREFAEVQERQKAALLSENASLRLANIRMKAACAFRQVQIGFLRTIHDIKSLLRNI